MSMSPAPRPLGARSVLRTCLVASTLSFAVPTVASAELVDAPAASAFRDSVGVQTHLDFQGYAYAEEPVDGLKAAIRGLGVRHIRDKVCLDKEEVCTGVRQRLADIGNTTYGAKGPRVGLMVTIMPNSDKPTARAERDAEILRGLRGLRDSPMASLAEGIEMVNEPDLKSRNWAPQTVADAQALQRFLALPEFSSIRHIPVLAPALGRQEVTSALVAAGWTPDLADVSNMHPYPPVWGTPEIGLESACDKGRTIVDCAESLGSSEAAIATESGYSTAGSSLTPDWLSQQAQATYSLRLLLHNFKEGVPRTYLYELIDLSAAPIDRNHGYGLMKARAGRTPGVTRLGGPKVAYQAVSRLNAIIGDLGGNARPGQLDLTLTNPATGEPVTDETMERVVLRRADGSFVLALWRPERAASWKPLAWPRIDFDYDDLTVAAQAVDVKLDGTKGGWQARRFAPIEAAGALESWTDVSSLKVDVNDDVTLIELQPPTALRGEVDPPAPVEPAPVDPVAVDPVAPESPVVPSAASGVTPSPTAPRTDERRPAAVSRTGAPAVRLPARAQVDAAREKANRRERARTRARRAYDACLRRQVEQAQRRKQTKLARLRQSRPTKEMRARCDRLLER